MDSCTESGTHSHSHKPTKKLVWALVLTTGFGLVEVYFGVISNATVLISDSGHMATDSASMLVALIVPGLLMKFWSDEDKAEAVATLICCFLLLIPCGFILYQGYIKLVTQDELDAGNLTIVAFIGLIVNIICFKLVHGKGEAEHGHKHSSLKGVSLHILGDMLASVAAILTGVISIFYPDSSTWVDIIGSLIILIILGYGLWRLGSASAIILWKSRQKRKYKSGAVI